MPEKITLTLPDGSKKEFKKGTTGLDIAKSIGARLASDALAVQFNGLIVELSLPIKESGTIKILTWNDLEGKKALWHTASHILNEAVQQLFPEALPTIGPPIDEGFYYDFDVKQPFTPQDLEIIEKKMNEIISKKASVQKKIVSKEQALKMFEKNNYKKELIGEFAQNKKELSVYFTGKFADLCKGGHVEDAGKIKAVKLLKTAGAYWHGDEKNKMLARIYGIAFPQQKMLDEFLELKEKAEKNSHIKLGKELEIFSMNSFAPGAVFFHSKGATIYNELIAFLRKEQAKRGYSEVISPLVMKKDLWVQSGHWGHYKENMFFTKAEDEDYAIKPMNCPGHVLIFKTKRHSYKDLPLRLAEFGTVHRLELSGVLNGLFRVRKFTQDDAHIFCSKEQLEEEIKNVISLIDFVYSAFGFGYHVELSTRPEKSMGSDEIWEKATTALKNALADKKVNYKISNGTGAFYGPKIDFHIKDSLSRNWQLGTVQVDFSMPEKFETYFINSYDKKETPVMVHRAIFGSLERFIGILIEHFGGNFPLWLSPTQTVVLPVSEKSEDFAQQVHETLLEHEIRSQFDTRKETVSYKVRDAQMQKVPYIITVGEKEKEKKTLAIRARDGKVTFGVKIPDFISQIQKEIRDKN